MTSPAYGAATAASPAPRIDQYGDRRWYVDGLLHRPDGPAVERLDGTRVWYLSGRRHRVNGPAIEQQDGSRLWYDNDQLHRVDGPAVELASGTREWYVHDQLHRADGPAIEKPDGSREWFLVGVKLTAEEHAAFQDLSSAAREAVLVFLTDGMPPRSAIGAARLVLV
jgi:hypothetical protein